MEHQHGESEYVDLNVIMEHQPGLSELKNSRPGYMLM